MIEKSNSVQALADKIKTILEDKELLDRLVAQDATDGSVSATLDELDQKVTELRNLYPD